MRFFFVPRAPRAEAPMGSGLSVPSAKPDDSGPEVPAGALVGSGELETAGGGIAAHLPDLRLLHQRWRGPLLGVRLRRRRQGGGEYWGHSDGGLHPTLSRGGVDVDMVVTSAATLLLVAAHNHDVTALSLL